jgi:hydroxymethylpyrimidine kinase/phosphomethylpyrimidine kinase/thiamine-phosphate diphosphorylase
LALGCKSILIKGGHGEDPTHCHDFWSNGESSLDLYSPRKPHKFRGTGCTLASAIAGFYARTDDLRESLVLAKSFINQCINESSSPYLTYSSWPKANILPTTAINKYKFLDCGPKPLGFYPIVDRAQWLEKLLPLGVSTIQLRIKDLSSTELEKEIVKAVRLARQYSCRLFINDYWELAVKHQAYGVHLGQEDLETADLNLINSSGLRLGISTHNYEEASHAAAFSPSYVALGPIYETTAKKMKFAPQGLDKLEIWAQLFSCPVVAIGGLDLERGRLCLRSGASGVAVMSGITQNKKPMTAAKDWMQLATTLPTSLQPA